MIFGYLIPQVQLETVSLRAGRVTRKCKTRRIYLNKSHLNKCDNLRHSVNRKDKTQI